MEATETQAIVSEAAERQREYMFECYAKAEAATNAEAKLAWLYAARTHKQFAQVIEAVGL